MHLDITRKTPVTMRGNSLSRFFEIALTDALEGSYP
jgi:hypothetical protein